MGNTNLGSRESMLSQAKNMRRVSIYLVGILRDVTCVVRNDSKIPPLTPSVIIMESEDDKSR